ncbi:MAG TPA: type II toxin-antitoxin system Phd/YefM family antitoxin [Candidatus Copromorpha excrementigallinarum]|uniref:Antitoxin n=1 Tax=Candidatus Allocopromorpha excrementigallinarum TaxID=2840742 RepID=A0A9D1HYS5_9FIRM|nr:type II toxin-antitoxin system Phd/YefM family antitoxin [Candidatus Copromorpha excrementigallinarum]
MGSISATKAREHIYGLIEQVNDESEPILITNNKGHNAVLISEGDWKAIQETLYLNSIPGMTKSILKAAGEPAESCGEYDGDEEW